MTLHPKTPQLTGSHRRTYETLFRHPVARNLQWRDVRSMLSVLGEAAEQENGNLKVTRNGQTLVLHRQHGKNVAEIAEVMEIRHFLQRSGALKSSPVADGEHLLVVIDHRHASVYKAELHGSVPTRIIPYNPTGEGRHLHYVQENSNGQRKPEPKEFYEAVAKTLQNAAKILIFGGGTGASSAMEGLLAELKQHHQELAKRIVGSVVIDEQHLTEDQLLARAREFYATIVPNEESHIPADNEGRPNAA